MDHAADLHALFAAATDDDPTTSAAALLALQSRTGPDIVEATLERLDHATPAMRAAAAEVASQLDLPPEAMDSVGTVIANRLLIEKVPMVLAALCGACGHFDRQALVEPLAALASHPDRLVREGVVFGLMGREDAASLPPLVALTADDDGDVRAWATYALGAQSESDDPMVRDALAARLTDAHDLTRREAIAGLARRGAPEAVEPLRQALAAGELDPMLLEAAAELGEPALRPALDALHGHAELTPWIAEALDEAIARCDPDAEV